MRINELLSNESGSALIFALMMLVLLTIMGLSGLNNTDFELKIAANDSMNKRDFYVAESGWNHGIQWLDNLINPPSRVNSSITDTNNDNYWLVRNYGNGANGVLNDTFQSTTTADGSLTGQNVPYWFKAQYESDNNVAGSGGLFRQFTYLVTSTVNGQQTIEVRVQKIFKSGY